MLSPISDASRLTGRAVEPARSEEELQFRRAIENCIPAGLIAISTDGQLMYVNRTFCDMVGRSEHELLGARRPYPFWPEEERDRIPGALDQVLAGEACESGYELYFQRSDGDYVEVLVKSSPLLNDRGDIRGWVASVSDITDFKRAERTTRFLMSASMEIAQSLDYESILDSIANLVVPTYGDWCVVDVLQSHGNVQHVAVVHSDPNRVWLMKKLQRNYPTSGYLGGEAEVIRTGLPQLYSDITDDVLAASAIDEEHLALLRQMAPRSAMILPLNARGRVLGVIVVASLSSSRGRYTERDLAVMEELCRHCAIAVDKARLYEAAQQELTERRRAEDALRKSEERLRYTLSAASVGTWDWNIPTNALHWSENLCRLHGVPPESLTGTFADFERSIHPDDLSRVLDALHHAIECDHAFDVEYRLKGHDGSIRWLEGKGRVIRDGSGQVTGMAGVCTDITDRRLSEDRFRVAVEASPSAFVMVDEAGIITLVNTQTERLFGYTRQEILGQSVELLVPTRFRQDHPGLRRQFHASPHARPMGAGRDLYCLRKDGSEFPVEIALSPITMPGGTFVLSAIVDITERKRAEDAMRQMNQDLRQKNQQMEQFVYTVSHDLKSPIVTSMGFLGMLKEDLRDGKTDQVLDSVERIERATNRMSELIDDLLELSRIGRVLDSPEEVDVSKLVRHILEDFQGRIAQRNAKVTVQEDMPRIFVDRKRFVDVFENLITNALKYGCASGQALIEVGAAIGDGEVRYYVRDNGPGIDEEYHSRIFGLFQRLRNDQEGTGVGLAIVARIVEVHGGRAWVESAPGKGATFWIAVPQDRIRR